MARRAKKRTAPAPEANDDVAPEAIETQDASETASADVVESAVAEETAVADEADQVDADVNEMADIAEDAARDQTEVATAPEPTAGKEKSRSGAGLILAMLIGGAISAALGFGAARYLESTQVVEGPTPDGNAAAIGEQQAALDQAMAEIAELKQMDLEAPARELVTPIDARLAQATERLDFMSEQLSALTERVETIAMRPTATGVNADEFDGALAAFRDQLNAAISEAQTEISQAREEATRISEDAFSAEQSAMVRAAWAQVTAALDSGEPFSDSLNTLQEIGGVSVPAPISDASNSGVPTLAALQAAFPDAAREALMASRAADATTPADGFISFLRAQTGARSLAPREGDDPDAVLSRAEAALRSGDVTTALAEVEALPEVARAELAEWEALAQARRAALEAAEAVSAELNSN